jgi:hypothetical protein
MATAPPPDIAVSHPPLAPQATASLPPPRSGVVWWIGLLVVGLLAGGLSAGAVIAILRWWRPDEISAPPPPPIALGTSDAGAPDAWAPPAPDAAVSEPEPGLDPPRARTSPVSTMDPPDAGGDEASPIDASAPNPREIPERGGNGTSRPPRRDDGGGAASEPTDPLSLARRALRGGDPTGCVDILDDLIAQGATPIALRDRAACLMRLGERTEAIRDYQRFCRLAPDHPAISEVRDVLEGMGQTCP